MSNSLVNNAPRQDTLRDAWNQTGGGASLNDRMDSAHDAAMCLRSQPAHSVSRPVNPAPGRPAALPPGGAGMGVGGGMWNINIDAPPGLVDLRQPSSAAQYINELFAAKELANLNALRAAYDRNVLKLNATGEQIPREFKEAQNRLAAQSAVQRANFNEHSAGRGLGSGAGSQAYLSMSNALQNNLSNLARSETEAQANLALQRAKLETAYRNDVAQAISDGNLARARALYDDFVRVDNLLVSVSRNQADMEMRVWRANLDAALALARMSG